VTLVQILCTLNVIYILTAHRHHVCGCVGVFMVYHFLKFHTVTEMSISYHFGLKGEDNVNTASVSFYILPLFSGPPPPPQ
jgi:hypothetical protein